MRRTLLIVGLALLAPVPSPAGAQIDAGDIPMPPGIDLEDIPMPPGLGPDDIPMPPGLGPDDIPMPKGKRAVAFKVSLYGVQRYAQRGREQAAGPGQCWDTRGTRTSTSVVRFSTRRPVRATVERLGGILALLWRGRQDPPLPVRATFTHDGSVAMEELDCINHGLDEWQPVPPPDERNCTAELDHLGFGLQLVGAALEATPGERGDGPAVSPFEGCPWGDRSGELYGAKGRVRLGELLREDKTEVVLRFRERDPFADGKATSVTTRKTTIYVVFKRVG